MIPNYVAKKSKICALNLACILFFWLIIPLIIQIYKIIEIKNEVIEFYDDKIVVKGGVFSKYERQSVFFGVYSVTVRQSFLGRIFKYGDVSVDCPGKWDVYSYGIVDPEKMKQYLETKIIARYGVSNVFYG